MLRTLAINNVALIDNLSIDFENNLNVLSGETGAGKSIIIDALSFVLGARTSKTLIKEGSDFMKVTAMFMPPFPNEVQNIFDDYEIEYEDGIVISRKISIDGKSEIKINGSPFNLTMLRSISQMLVDIHGQHEHQKILQSKYHLEIVDSFIKEKDIFTKYTLLYDKLNELNKAILSLNSSTENQERLLDLLNYQINEIEDAKLTIGEDEILEEKLYVMQNSQKIFDSLNDAYGAIDNPMLIDSIKKTSSFLNYISKYDKDLDSLINRLETTKYELQDICSIIKEKIDSYNFDSYEVDKIQNRLDVIKALKRKYGDNIEKVLTYYNDSKLKYQEIKNSKQTLEKKLQEKQALLEEIYSSACDISNLRRKVAKTLEEKTQYELDFLGMKNSTFKVEFADYPDINDFENTLTSRGFDRIVFMFSANKGQGLKPLSEIISGGEASRFMLALKNILASSDNIDMMVFDEIDTGISGEMGYKVACKLASISREHQVLSVSHLPQICAMADNNILISKYVQEDDTKVIAIALDKEKTLAEIARLSGGDVNNSISLQHASMLKEKCNKYKLNNC